MSKHNQALSKERIATKCICCGGKHLSASPAIIMPFVSDRALGWKPTHIDESWGLRSIRSGMAYALCNSLLCNECDLVFMDVRFSEQEMARLYRNYRGEEYTALREFYEPGYINRNIELGTRIPYLNESEKFISQYILNPKSVLDWGGDTGINTPFLSTASSVTLYDISEKRDRSGESISSRLRLEGRDFDLISCCNVLEHVPYPAEVLRDISRYMSYETILFVEVPFETLRIHNGPTSVLKLKRHWHEHINFFSEKSLRELVDLAGLRVLGFRELETKTTGNQAYVFQLVCSLNGSDVTG